VKDVTAFANSAGGQIIYGIPEKDRVPQPLDGGVNSNDISREWIEQIIISNSSPRVQGVKIQAIPLNSTQPHMVAYVITIPQATSFAPHQNTEDRKYYCRFEFQSVPMYDYEIRDILRRATVPELALEFKFGTGNSTAINFPSSGDLSDPVKLVANVINKASQPALYAALNIFIDEAFSVVSTGGLSHLGTLAYERGCKQKIFEKNWVTPHCMPIFYGIALMLTDTPLVFRMEASSIRRVNFYIGYEIHAPGFSTRRLIHIAQYPGGTLNILGEIEE